jgi:hypothetical protein
MKKVIKFYLFFLVFLSSVNLVQAASVSFSENTLPERYKKFYDSLYLGENNFSKEEWLLIFDMLWEAPYLIKNPIENGEYLVVNAARFNQVIFLKMLLNLGAHVNAKDTVQDFSLLMFAVLHENIEVVTYLLSHKDIDFEFVNKDGLSAFSLGMSAKNKKIIKLLNKKRTSPLRLLRRMKSNRDILTAVISRA